MATIGNDSNGRRRILFVAGDGSRKTVRVGKASMKQAEAFKVKLEALIGGGITGSVDDETSRWLAGLDDKIHARLAAVGLVKERTGGRAVLGTFIDAFIASRPDMKEHTRLNWIQVRTWLVKHFAESRDMRSIDHGDAQDWQTFMAKAGLGENTIRRHIGRARQLFKAAIRRGLVRGVNPFEGMSATVRADKARLVFVSRETISQVLDACPDPQWRLMIVLARYGGLRCPSEHLALKWSDVDWERGRMTVRSPKTEHHKGKDSRMVPLFPELRPYLLESFELAEPGTEHVITRYRERYANLRTHFARIIERAGVKSWAKPWQNLRSTRQTELAELYPIHVVCAWIGNSEAVAQEHYLQVTDSHFAAAIREPLPSAAQNPAQYPAVSSQPEPQMAGAEMQNRPDLPGDSAGYHSVRERSVPPRGVEQIAETTGNQEISERRGTESGTLSRESGFAEAVAAVMRLPLTDAEKAEAVRRLLTGTGR